MKEAALRDLAYAKATAVLKWGIAPSEYDRLTLLEREEFNNAVRDVKAEREGS